MVNRDAETDAEEVTLTIDGVKVKTQAGTPILKVAKQLGINIPTLCYHSAVSPYASCRVCVVEITDNRGRKRIVTSCNYPAADGLIVETNSETVRRVRREVLKLLLARCPKVVRIRNLAAAYGVQEHGLWIADESEDCILCGLCVRVCGELIGVSAINFANRGVKRVVTTPYDEFSEDCIGCGACAIVCPTGSKRVRNNVYSTIKPLTGPNKDENLGAYVHIFSGKSSIDGQDGGVVSAILLSGLNSGIFNKAIVVHRSNGYRAEAVVAETPEEVLEARGTKYFRVKIVPKLKELIANGERKIAVVGTPCQARAARKIQQTLQQQYPDLDLAIIGLFCFEAFNYQKLKEEVRLLLGVDIDSSEKVQIRRGKFTITSNGKNYSCKVKELENAVEKGCIYCNDFPALYADISVGAVGSEEGFSTVIVRTEKGEKMLENVKLTHGNLNLEEVQRASELKKNRAKKNFEPIIAGIRETRLAGGSKE